MIERNQQSELMLLAEHYLDLESMEITEKLLDVCGATIDARALPLLRQRLQEEETQIPLLQARGYVRMCEKSEQLVRSLRPLIVLLEQSACEDKR
jgi:hypothetical protein